MAQCKRDVTPLLTHWSYIYFALSHPYVVCKWRCLEFHDRLWIWAQYSGLIGSSYHVNFCVYVHLTHDVQFSCVKTQPLLAHHWRVHQCLLTSRFIAPRGKMRKQLLKDHNFLNNSPILIIESSTFNIFAFQKALHTIHFNLKNCFGFGERYLTP